MGLGVALAAFLLTLCHFAPYLTGEFLIRHDSKVGVTIAHLFFDNLIRGWLPLWIPEQNAGEPLWPVAETVVAFDPVAVIVWGAASVFRWNSSIAYAWCLYLWLILFALGGMQLSRRIERNTWIQLFVFVFLFGGPLMLALNSQSGFIFPFRYFPWVVLAMFRFFESPTRSRALWMGALAGFSTSHYQTIYSLVFLVPLFVVLVLRYRAAGRNIWLGTALAAVVALLWALPQLFSGLALMDLVAMPREYGETNTFAFAWSDVWEGLFDFSLQQATWHGTTFVGALPLLLTLLFPFTLARRFQVPPLVWAALLFFMMAVLLSTGKMDQYLRTHRTFLGLRNWGLIATLVFLFWSLILAHSLKWLSKRLPVAWAQGGLALLCVLMTAEAARSLSRPEIPLKRSPQFQVPLLGGAPLSFATKRLWQIDDFFPLVPYQHQAPALLRTHVAFMEPLIMDDRFKTMYRLTQQVRLPRYHALVTSMVPEPDVQKILGSADSAVNIVGDVIAVPNAAAALEKLTPGGAHPSFVEGLHQSFRSHAKGTWRLLRYLPHEASFEVSVSDKALFSWADSYTPDWTVTVDGKRAPLLVANVVQKAVLLSPGKHQVTFKYFPFEYVLSFWVRAALGVFLLGTILVRVSNNLTAVIRVAKTRIPSHAFRNLSRT